MKTYLMSIFLVCFWKTGFLTSAMAPWLSLETIIDGCWVIAILFKNRVNQMAFLVVSAIASNFAAMVESAEHDCR